MDKSSRHISKEIAAVALGGDSGRRLVRFTADNVDGNEQH